MGDLKRSAINMNPQPKFEKYALTILILVIIGFIATLSGRFFPLMYPGMKTQISLYTTTFAGVFMILSYLLRIAIAAWLWTQSKYDNRAKWTWTALGLFGGLWAPVLYFLIPIAEDLRSKKINQ